MLQHKIYSIAALILIACTSACKSTGVSHSNTNKDLAGLDTIWTLTYITGPRIAFDGLYPNKKPYIKIETSSNHVSGFSGCNNFMGPVIIKNDSLRFGNMAATMKACVEGAVGETTFNRALSQVQTYTINNDTLYLRGADAITLMKLSKGLK